MASSKKFSRRRFLRESAALASAGAAAPYVIPSGVLAAPGKPGANDRIGIGFIGVSRRGKQLIDHVPEGGRIVAISDCSLPRCAETVKQKEKAGSANWKIHHDYRKMLESRDVDAVIVATRGWQRVLPCIHACQAGKDIYAEKPLTLTIGEGRVLVEAVRKYKRVFQTGTQQRSMEMNRFACELVRTGGSGKLHTIIARNYHGFGRTDLPHWPEEPVPEGLDWDMWLAQVEFRPFTRKLWPEGRGCPHFGCCSTTNMGPHGLDQVQWALGMDQSGPVEVWPVTEGLSGKVSFRYANGVILRMELEKKGPSCGAIFVGDKAKIEINRNKFTTNPPDLVKNPPAAATAKIWEGPGWITTPHMQNWFDSIKSREKPNADVEIGQRSTTVCHLANIVRQIGRKLKWDPEKEIFPGDSEANGYLSRPQRKGYELPAEV